MPRKISKKGLHKRAIETFNAWVRRRPVPKNENLVKDNKQICVSCNIIHSLGSNQIQAGHYYHGKFFHSAMDERNVWPQCIACNKYRDGNPRPYAQFLIGLYGVDILEILQELKHQGWKPSREELEHIIAEYENKDLI